MSIILLIDNDERFFTSIDEAVNRMGHEVVCVQTLADGLKVLGSDSFDVVLLNAILPDGKGLDAMSKILEAPSIPEVILLTDSGDPDEAELAIRNGAWDYIERPPNTRALTLSLTRVLQYRAKKVTQRSAVAFGKDGFKDIVGKSGPIQACIELLAMAAGGDANVLITGETGTGKELFAWAIHKNSARATKRFVVVDCASLPETLVESTLFGYEKGAFTGAHRTNDGLIKRADGGTLFLDEVGELPLSTQKSFLRVLHERRFRHVGGTREIRSDFRLIAATNRDLDEMVRHRHFRKDLLFRLRAFGIELPPLRRHAEDIRDLAAYYTSELCKSNGLAEKQFSPDFLDVLASYEWPGNVRELFNALERAMSAARAEPIIFPKHLPTYIRVQLARSSVVSKNAHRATQQECPDTAGIFPKLAAVRETAMVEAERNYLKEVLRSTKGNIPEACRIAGVSRSRFYVLLKKYNLLKPPYDLPAVTKESLL
jgi:two-component system, NtrC family, response regulator